jgi:hypothetical protein
MNHELAMNEPWINHHGVYESTLQPGGQPRLSIQTTNESLGSLQGHPVVARDTNNWPFHAENR